MWYEDPRAESMSTHIITFCLVFHVSFLFLALISKNANIWNCSISNVLRLHCIGIEGKERTFLIALKFLVISLSKSVQVAGTVYVATLRLTAAHIDSCSSSMMQLVPYIVQSVVSSCSHILVLCIPPWWGHILTSKYLHYIMKTCFALRGITICIRMFPSFWNILCISFFV